MSIAANLLTLGIIVPMLMFIASNASVRDPTELIMVGAIPAVDASLQNMTREECNALIDGNPAICDKYPSDNSTAFASGYSAGNGGLYQPHPCPSSNQTYCFYYKLGVNQGSADSQ